jgi:hypothetical protein
MFMANQFWVCSGLNASVAVIDPDVTVISA